MAVQHSSSGTATGIGGRSGKPVVNCTPEKACAMRSSPRSPASGPVWPNGEMRRTARRGLRALERGGREARGLEPPRPQVLDERVGGREERRETSRPTRGRRGSARTEHLPRFSDWK